MWRFWVGLDLEVTKVIWDWNRTHKIYFDAVSSEVLEASQELLQMKWEPYTSWHVKQTPGSKEGIGLHTCNLPCPNSKCWTATVSCYRKQRAIKFHPQVDDIQTTTYQDDLTNGSKCRNWFQALKTQLATTTYKPSRSDFNFDLPLT